jgi:DNA-binding Xre family transcriptional regulator
LKDLAEQTGVSVKTFRKIKKGENVFFSTVNKICEHLSLDVSKYFSCISTDNKLSGKTIRHHHNLISGILSFALDCNSMLLTYQHFTRYIGKS